MNATECFYGAGRQVSQSPCAICGGTDLHGYSASPERKPTMKITELRNPATVAWRPDGSHEVCWVRGSRTLLLGMKGPEGKWFTTPISAAAYEHDGTLKGARDAAHRFIADAMSDDD